MSRVLIFGGTTEGRLLAEWCGENDIPADISVTTDYGAELIKPSACTAVLTGKLDSEQMAELMLSRGIRLAVDATHPYAREATANILRACGRTGVRYARLLRDRCEPTGTCVPDMDALISLLNGTDRVVLSTLGSKELPELAKVHDRKRRVWLRVLPADGIVEQCVSYGFDASHVITGKGPFSVSDNKEHILRSGAELLITKESGKAGGYPEKTAAARECGIETVTLIRPQEDGHTFEQLKEIIGEET